MCEPVGSGSALGPSVSSHKSIASTSRRSSGKNPFSQAASGSRSEEPRSKIIPRLSFSDEDGISPLSVYLDESPPAAGFLETIRDEDTHFDGACEEDKNEERPCHSSECDDTPLPRSNPRTQPLTQPLGLVSNKPGFVLGPVPPRGGKVKKATGKTTEMGEPARVGRERPPELNIVHAEDTSIDGAFDEGKKKEKPCYSYDCDAGDDTPMPLQSSPRRTQPWG